jgi:LuxR family transcriptional regulator, maltose regulon positive regulatory protein
MGSRTRPARRPHRLRRVSGAAPAIIERKLSAPPLAERVVARPRLERLIGLLVERYPVVWVAATAGAGKTTAVVQAARSGNRPVAWLTVDATDAAPGRLVTYLEAALARRRPKLAGTATRALAQRAPHAEAAGLLAEAIGDEPLLVVLDELERLADAPEALAVLSAFVRYAPATTRIVLITRREIALELGIGQGLGRVAAVGEGELAFTDDEAAQALAGAGRTADDVGAVVEATGGWVTGVLFEAWRSADHIAGLGGEADPLNGYLSSQILGQLEPGDREFLITTAVLDEVTPERAEALAPEDAHRLAGLRNAHLPVAWTADGRTMRCHPRFREYLLERLHRRRPAEIRAVRAAYGRLLAAERHHEDAVEELIRAGDVAAAREAAEASIASVVERLDYAVAERWLNALDTEGPATAGRLTEAELMLAIGREDYARGARVADALHTTGEREPLARRSSAAASMMAWCYWHRTRVEDARAVMAVAPPSPEIEAMRYLLTLVDGETTGDARMAPALSGGPLDGLIMRVHYAHGRLRQLGAEPASRWAAAVSMPWRIGTLRATGHTEQALALYQAADVDLAAVWLHAIVGVEILTDLRRADAARAALLAARERIAASGSLVYELLNQVMEAKLELRLHRDAARARATLEALERRPAARRYGFVAEALDTWFGYALLLEGDHVGALKRLRAAVARMLASDRIIELPSAAVYLAEAEWRAGDEDAADRAADLALAAAGQQGSNHILLQALADFPAVVARRIDAEPLGGSPWHELGRALAAQGVAVGPQLGAVIELHEFGRRAITVDGVEVRPRIAKAYELLAALAAAPGRAVGREALLEGLFDGRADESARAYLRQAVHRLREVLPAGVELVADASGVAFATGVVVSSESARFERLLAEAARLQGEERLQATTDALALVDAGEYLPGARSVWVDARREDLAELAADARLVAAELQFALGGYGEAGALVAAVLARDPYREAAWRLQMRLAGAVGDEDRVIAAYRRCERALDRLGTTPSETTRRLLDALRR